MPLVTAGMMAQARAIGYQGLTSSGTITRITYDEGDFGSEEVVTVVGTFPCWVREMHATSVGSVAHALGVTQMFRIHFEYGADVRPGDRLTISDVTYEVNDTNSGNTIAVFTTATARVVE